MKRGRANGRNEREVLIAVIGRGHSGTRILAHTLYASGVAMGAQINGSGDTIPPKSMYEAGLRLGPHVEWTGGLSWRFDRLHTMEIEPEFETLVRAYLRSVLRSGNAIKGWKLPETVFGYPWIVRMFPEARYLHIVRDPRDCVLAPHFTDDLRRCNVPCPEFNDVIDKRVASWKYQHEIVKQTPQPKHFISVRFEDLVLDREATVGKLEGFLEMPLARVVMDETRVGRWKLAPDFSAHQFEPLATDMHELGYE